MKQNLILYPAGCYGTFFEWIFNFLEGTKDTLPFNDNGNSHKFKGNSLWPPEKIFEHVNSNNRYHFSRCHPHIVEKVNEHELVFQKNYHEILQDDLDYLKNHFDKTLILAYDEKSILWFENNGFDKIVLTIVDDKLKPYGYSEEFFKELLTSDPILRTKHLIDNDIKSISSTFNIENLLGWNKTSIYDFDIWELRELLSLYHFSKNFGQIQAWKTLAVDNPNNMFIFIDSLRDEFIYVILKAAEYFNITVDNLKLEELKKIHKEWVVLQRQMNKDFLCNQIVKSIISNEYFDWSDATLSIIDEAWIQKSLNDAGLQFCCYNLNIFPTNTHDFLPLLEKS